MTVAEHGGRNEPRTVPGVNPRVVAYLLLNAGAILAAIGLALLTHRAGWALVVLGLVVAVEGVVLVDVPRGPARHPERPPDQPVRAAQPTPRVRFPEPPPGPAGASTRG